MKALYVKNKFYFWGEFFLLFNTFLYSQRSIHRPRDPKIPHIQVNWQDDPRHVYKLADNHFEEYALFHKFDEEFFKKYLLPQEEIFYRYEPEKYVKGSVLSALIEDFLQELLEGARKRKTFKNFIILKMSDFNFRTSSGIIVIKFKQYPFVVKLFMENPHSFVRPDSKGFEQYCFFIMGGGINRYLAGFTRIKNLEIVRQCVANDPYWADRVDFPRKWFWQPHHNKFFIVKGFNINNVEQKTIVLPSIYAIICDEIIMERPFSLMNKTDRKWALELSYFLDLRIDPHINNFLIEKSTQKIVIVDTEHFPSMIGLRKPVTFKSYLTWYRQLMWKFAENKFGRSKRKRREMQHDSNLGLLKF